MIPYIGDFSSGVTVRYVWASNTSIGGSVTRATNGTISIYKDGGVTQSTTGITDTEDFDSLTGVHSVAVNQSADGTFYSTGSDFWAILSAATIDGQTVNAPLFSWSVENRSSLRPTTAGRTLDVTATGAAGIDWGNVENPTTAVNLSATNIDIDQVVASVTGAVGSVTGAVGSVAAGGIAAASFAAGAITATVIATDAIDADAIADNAINAGAIATGAITAAKFAAGAIDAAAIATDAIDADAIAAGAIDAAAIANGAIDAATFAAGAIDAAALATDAGQEIADRILARAVAGGADTGRTIGEALKRLRNRTGVAAGTLTVYEADDTTPSWTATVTTTAGNPVSDVNPA